MDAESTKLRIVYDATAREKCKQPSLNDCLNPGPSLQNRLWDILVRSRFYPVLLTGDLKKAFLQIRIKEKERDTLRFHWKPNRLTRALFGMTYLPSLLGGVINQHLNLCYISTRVISLNCSHTMFLIKTGAREPDTCLNAKTWCEIDRPESTCIALENNTGEQEASKHYTPTLLML